MKLESGNLFQQYFPFFPVYLFMEFGIDKQTFNDLDVFTEERNKKSVFSLFSHVKTLGGFQRLTQILDNPTHNLEILTDRRDSIRYFFENQSNLEVRKSQLDFIERYLNLNIAILKPNLLDAFSTKIENKWWPKNDLYILAQGIENILALFSYLSGFLQNFSKDKAPDYLTALAEKALKIMGDNFLPYPISSLEKRLSWLQISKYDCIFRVKKKEDVHTLLQIVYELDVFQSVAQAVVKHNLCFPEYLNYAEPQVELEAISHPFIQNPVPNDFYVGGSKHMCFLTGPNMAGKSTFLKSVGLAIYLAHIGFPVPAKSMKTTAFQGLTTTINLSDNINFGYSHYFNEVKRVKDTALQIEKSGSLFVIFDELFRGTNVKDAYDATLSIVTALSNIPKCVFLISTHIIEVAEALQDLPSIQFNYFDSNLPNDELLFSYKLKEGITHERLGMQIIKKEGILEILQRCCHR